MTQLTHGSLFSGIGGFDLGFERAGFRTIWAVEKEPFCRAVLRTHFPETELFNDVRDVGKHNLAAVDVLTFGFPCQDLSVAGKRAGLGGTRSGLFWEAHRIVGELRPRFFLAENVPGLFSSNEGEDFALVLRELADLGYGLAWRVFNSQFFRVAQRRRRVFIVGCLGKPCPAEILFEPEGGEGDFAACGEERPRVAAPLTSGVGVTGNAPGRRREDDYNLAYCLQEDPAGIGQGHNTTFAVAATLPADHRFTTDSHVDNLQPVATAISASNGHHGHSSPRGDGSDNIIVQQAISSKWAKGSSGPAGAEHHNLIAIQDVRGMRDKRKNGIGIDDSGGPMYTLDGTSQHAVCGAITNFSSGGSDDNDGRNGFLHVGTAPDSDRMRSFAGLPQGLDSARYRALGNAVTVSVAFWLAQRIKPQLEGISSERKSNESEYQDGQGSFSLDQSGTWIELRLVGAAPQPAHPEQPQKENK